MPVTAWKTPASLASITGPGTTPGAWTNPDNAALSDDVRATSNPAKSGRNTNYLRATGFGFTNSDIPVGKHISGVEVIIEWYTSVAVPDHTVQIVSGGTRIGQNKGGALTVPATESDITYGGSNDNWGNAVNDIIVKDPSFGVDFVAGPVTASTTVYVDSIRVRIHYEDDVYPPSILTPDQTNTPHNSPLVLGLEADEPVTWTIGGGADAVLFEIQGSDLTWKDNAARLWYDIGSNTYYVTVKATDRQGLSTTKALEIVVQTPQQTAGSTGWKSPGVITHPYVKGAGSVTPSTEAELVSALASNGGTSVLFDLPATSGEPAVGLEYKQFDFNIPADASITDVRLGFRVSTTSDFNVTVMGYGTSSYNSGFILGNSRYTSQGTQWVTTTTTLTDYTYPSAETDSLDFQFSYGTPPVSEFNDPTFGFRHVIDGSPSQYSSATLDRFQIRVDYTIPAIGGGTRPPNPDPDPVEPTTRKHPLTIFWL